MTTFGRSVPIGLSALAAGLCLLIAQELSGSRYDTSLAPTARPAVAQHPSRAAAPAMTDQREAWLNEIMARPLFNPDRHPIEVGVGGLPRLSGIVVAGSESFAIFAAPSSGRPILAQPGARIGAYEVQTIANQGVTVVGPEGTSVIRPAFDSARSAAPMPARPNIVQPVRPTLNRPTVN